jgi:hypothetical protein
MEKYILIFDEYLGEDPSKKAYFSDEDIFKDAMLELNKNLKSILKDFLVKFFRNFKAKRKGFSSSEELKLLQLSSKILTLNDIDSMQFLKGHFTVHAIENYLTSKNKNLLFSYLDSLLSLEETH